MYLKLSTRLILNSLLLSLVPLLIVSFYSLYITGIEIENDARNKLILARESKAYELKEYFKLTEGLITTLAENPMIISAIKDFRLAMDDVDKTLGKRYDEELEANENLLRTRYTQHKANTPEAPKDAISKWWPKDRIARILQHYYIAANPFENKQELIFSTDGSRYSQIHHLIHPMLRSFKTNLAYHDILLVNTDGRIIYTIEKEIDFATNLITGPHSNTPLGHIFKQAIESNTAGSIYITDIAAYAPSFNADSLFIASPVFDGETKVGVLVLQLKVEHLEEIMTNAHRWEENGLGKTGEAILVGTDHLLRSETRHMIEDPTQLIRHLKAIGIAENVIQSIEKHKNTVNALEFRSPVVDAALDGQTGLIHANDFMNEPSIITYTPVSFGDVHWALLVMMDEEEAFATSNELRIIIWSVMAILAALAALIGWFMARSISKPITATISSLSSSSSQMAATTAEYERIANQQAASVNETNTTMEELGISSKQSAQQAQAASEVVQTVLNLAEDGGHQVQEMLHGMEVLKDKVEAIAQQILRLSEQTNQISSITGMMTDFANETKMLAMNAAVEAVRAGEQGRGFSVLSVEIRKLAEESRHSAERINALVGDVQKATNATVMSTEEGTKTVEKTIELAHTTAASFHSVAESMHSVSTSAQQISLNVKQQSEAIRQVVVAMNELKAGAKEGAAGISQTKDGIKALNEAALKLKAMT